jgi:hypothetical protein
MKMALAQSESESESDCDCKGLPRRLPAREAITQNLLRGELCNGISCAGETHRGSAKGRFILRVFLADARKYFS